MASRNPPKHISCRRCQEKKIRCNRADPTCDKCTASGVQCVYLSRKPRTTKRAQLADGNNRDILISILNRLERLEDHCQLDRNAPDSHDDRRSMSTTPAPPLSTTPRRRHPVLPAVVQMMLASETDPAGRTLLETNMFCHLQNLLSLAFDKDCCMKAIESAIAEVRAAESAQGRIPTPSTVIPKELAKRLIDYHYKTYQFEGFHAPLDKSFILSIPDLLEIPHVQLDYTSQIIYYNVLLQGIMLDPENSPGRGQIIHLLCQKCNELSGPWLDQIKDTPADLSAAFHMISLTLEGSDSEASWKILGHACRIARALGYFDVDSDRADSSERMLTDDGSTAPNEEEIERNRKRFEFWHLLRADCLFRLSFRKPTHIPKGSWAVNFPDPTITGVDDTSTHFVQIHFLASMRLTLVLLKYLDLIEEDSEQDPATYDMAFDGLIDDVQSIMSDWSPEELLASTVNHVDTWFVVDILYSSYRMIITFHQAKKCNQNSEHLPPQTVEVSRKSLQKFQTLLSSSLKGYWGISLVLLYQFIPFFILCMDIIGSPERENLESDLGLVVWFGDYTRNIAEERAELYPVRTIISAMALACKKTAATVGVLPAFLASAQQGFS